MNTAGRIAFQGYLGAYSDLACRTYDPARETLSSTAFEDAFAAVAEGRADLAMIPVENTLAGRVADVHRLLPDSGLFIIAEHFQPIRHALLGLPGSSADALRHVHSHVHALPQCRKALKRLDVEAHVHADTAGAAADIARRGDPMHGAIASTLAAELYGLEILESNIQDSETNTTRFLVLAAAPQTPPLAEADATLTTVYFQVRNIPAALYKALGGFATNGLNLTKLESFVDDRFQAARFYCDIAGHPDAPAFRNAWDELGFYAEDLRLLGSYPAHPFRRG